MPSMNWIGRAAVENYHNQVPFHLLRCISELSPDDSESGNILIKGDNLFALKALLPYYAGQVKCIFIDPPYNTGEQSWAYNDAVNSPDIRKWLGATVGNEADDLTRHDKWLCMMYPRMQLLVKFLKPDGFLLVSLDDTELSRFRMMMEEILPPSSFITSMIWKSRRNLDNRSLHNVSIDHEYVVAYRLGDASFRGADKDVSKYSNPDNDPRGSWMSDNLVGLATKDRRPNLHYDLVNPETGIVYSCPDKGWRYSKETMAEKIREGRILWPKNRGGRPRHKKFYADLLSEFAGFSSFIDCGNTNEGTEEVSRIMGGEQFIFPKPRSLVQTLLQQTTSGDDIVLDCFAGTGTTAHAVLALNALDGGHRKFILVELEERIADNITRERISRVIKGYSWRDPRGIDHFEEGLRGGFKFCELGLSLFDENRQIRGEVSFYDIAQHVFFIETGQPLPHQKEISPLLGICNDKAVYLLYNGILKDINPKGGNVLTNELLDLLPTFDGKKVIYGTGCRLTEHRRRELGIEFKQIPYQIKEM